MRFITYHLKTQEMCNKAVEEDPYQLGDVPDHFKTHEMANQAIRNNPAVFFLFLTVLRQNRCVKRQCAENHGH